MRYTFLYLPLFLTVPLFSQIAPTSDSQAQATFQSNVRVVLLDVVVTDSNGTPVTGLTQNDFRVFEDDKPQTSPPSRNTPALPSRRRICRRCRRMFIRTTPE